MTEATKDMISRLTFLAHLYPGDKTFEEARDLIEQLQRDLDNAFMIAACILRKSGGAVILEPSDLVDARGLSLERMNMAGGSVRYRAHKDVAMAQREG
ncbi:hypothetical protein [Paraburkholderia sp. J11-2]|uniref:hypothetical protein n=1 Tax=Paraburkholderia sp. J11-2 TaxID=2805431 RepID=UPI002AB6E9AA|nr:hypothetical protein [Paraburkholderia sp. J11-2]